MDTHLFGVLEVLEESLLCPSDTLVDVGSSVGEALSLTSLTTEDTVRQAQVSIVLERYIVLTTYPWRLGPTLCGSPAPTVWH